MELISALGLDFKILLAQFINFAILVFILFKFGYKPMLKFLDDRRIKIEQGVLNAEKAQVKLEGLTVKEKEIIRQAKKDALQIIEEAKIQADKKRKEMVLNAKKEISVIIEDEKQKIRKEKEIMVSDAKKEVSDLVFVVVEKIIEQRFSNAENEKLIKKVISNLPK